MKKVTVKDAAKTLVVTEQCIRIGYRDNKSYNNSENTNPKNSIFLGFVFSHFV